MSQKNQAQITDRVYSHTFVVKPEGNQVCRLEPELWHSQNRWDQQAAKEACGSCPFMNACRLEGLINPKTSGVWGGLSRNDRQRLKVRGRQAEIKRLRALLDK